tara:strand:- start:212 stop:820 length:609 start_codon:yes stop_codon:yes gene_type:complete
MGEEKPQKEDKTTPTYKQKKPSKGSGLTISHTWAQSQETPVTISTYEGGDRESYLKGKRDTSRIYKDPNTGSTIATKQARTNIAEGGDYVVRSSTKTPEKTLPLTKAKYSDVETGQIMFKKPKAGTYQGPDTQSYNLDFVNRQKEIISAARPSKDLATGEHLKYSGPESTTAINKISPSLRRALFGGGMGSVLRRLSGLQGR